MLKTFKSLFICRNSRTNEKNVAEQNEPAISWRLQEARGQGKLNELLPSVVRHSLHRFAKSSVNCFYFAAQSNQSAEELFKEEIFMPIPLTAGSTRWSLYDTERRKRVTSSLPPPPTPTPIHRDGERTKEKKRKKALEVLYVG